MKKLHLFLLVSLCISNIVSAQTSERSFMDPQSDSRVGIRSHIITAAGSYFPASSPLTQATYVAKGARAAFTLKKEDVTEAEFVNNYVIWLRKKSEQEGRSFSDDDCMDWHAKAVAIWSMERPKIMASSVNDTVPRDTEELSGGFPAGDLRKLASSPDKEGDVVSGRVVEG